MADAWRMVLNIPKLRGGENWYSWLDNLSTILRNQDQDLWVYAEGSILFPTPLTEFKQACTTMTKFDSPPSPRTPNSPESSVSEGSFDSAISLPSIEKRRPTHARKHSWASKLNAMLSPKPRPVGHKRAASAISATSTSPSMFFGVQSVCPNISPNELTPNQLAWLKADRFVSSAIHLTCTAEIQHALISTRRDDFQTAAELLEQLKARYGPSGDSYTCWTQLISIRRHSYAGYWEFANAFRDVVRACREAGTKLDDGMATMQFLVAMDDGSRGFVWQRAKAIAAQGRTLDEVIGETGKAVAESTSNLSVGVKPRRASIRR